MSYILQQWSLWHLLKSKRFIVADQASSSVVNEGLHKAILDIFMLQKTRLPQAKQDLQRIATFLPEGD